MNFYVRAVAAERAWPSRAGPGLRGPPRRPRSLTRDRRTDAARTQRRETNRTDRDLADALHARTARPTHTQRSTAGRQPIRPSDPELADLTNVFSRLSEQHTYIFFLLVFLFQLVV